MADITSALEQLDLSRLQEPSRIHRENETGVASVFQFDIKQGAKVYRYDVEVTKHFRDTVKSLSTGGADDGLKYRFRMICEDAVTEFFRQTNGLGGGQFIYAFDGRKNLIANGNLSIPKSIKFEASVLPPRSRDVLAGAEIGVEIQPCQTEQSVIDISDIAPALQKSAFMQADHTLRMVLELLTTQPFLNDGTHSIVGAGKIFENKDWSKLENGVVLHRGIAKGARIIENYGHPVSALVVDVKTCAFYEPITLDQVYQQMMREQRGGGGGRFWDRFAAFFRGVRLEVTYDRSRTFVFWDVTMQSIGEMKIEKDGRSMLLVDYYKNEKNITIQDLVLPGVRPEGKKDKDTCYPFQCCRILPFQRVTIDRMSDRISRELLNANTTAPQVRFNAIEAAARQIGDLQTNCGKFLMKFGVKLVGNKNAIKIGVRNPPMIAFGDKEVGPKNGKFDERYYKYYSCSDILKSMVVGHPRLVPRGDVEKFIGMLMNAARGKGLMTLPKPEFMIVEYDDLEDTIKELSSKKKQFFFYIDGKLVKSHGILKVCEKRYTVITQHLTHELIKKAGGASVSNVLNKFHMKIAFQTGLNYLPKMEKIGLAKFDLSTGKVLVIGLDSSNAPRATPFERFQLKKEQIDADSMEPTVIGICANYVKQTHSFCGTYFYQPAKQDAILATKLHQGIKWVLGKVKKNRPNGKGPGLIVIIRDGVAEGQIPNAVKNEFVTIRNACLDFDDGYVPKFVFCVVDKSHNKRLFSGTKDQQKQNLLPSSVVDSGIVRPDISEFYMQSHFPLKGTAKVPQYVFPINEIKASNDELQALINCLCHSWQIVNLAPSLPTPVLQAHELAKRGRSNYVELKKMGKVPTLPNQQIDYEKLNTMLSYNSHPFAETRFNA